MLRSRYLQRLVQKPPSIQQRHVILKPEQSSLVASDMVAMCRTGKAPFYWNRESNKISYRLPGSFFRLGLVLETPLVLSDFGLAPPYYELGNDKSYVRTKDKVALQYDCTLFSQYLESKSDTDHESVDQTKMFESHMKTWKKEIQTRTYRFFLVNYHADDLKVIPLPANQFALQEARVFRFDSNQRFIGTLCAENPAMPQLAIGLLLGGIGPGLVWFAGCRLLLRNSCDNLYYVDPEYDEQYDGPSTAGNFARVEYKLKVALFTCVLIGICSAIGWTRRWIGSSPEEPIQDIGYASIVRDAVFLGIPHSLLKYAPSTEDRLEAQFTN